jgi:hypothetical protein
MMRDSLAKVLEDLHTRIAETVLALNDEDVLHWQPAPGLESIHDLILHAADEEHKWMAVSIANLPTMGGEVLAQVSARRPDDHPLFRLGSTGQFSQVILAGLTPADWTAQRQIGDQTLTVAVCVLHAIEELAQTLGQIQVVARLWHARQVIGPATSKTKSAKRKG